MPRWVVLLRAVNVGGRVLRMEAFRSALTAAGATEAYTVGASGNAVMRAAAGTSEGGLLRAVRAALSETADGPTQVFVRSSAEWAQVVQGNPFPREAKEDPAHLVVTVLEARPRPSAWDALRTAIVGRERVAAGGRHAYILYPDGIGRSKLTPQVIERHLGVRGTSRNWNTVLGLDELGHR